MKNTNQDKGRISKAKAGSKPKDTKSVTEYVTLRIDPAGFLGDEDALIFIEGLWSCGDIRNGISVQSGVRSGGGVIGVDDLKRLRDFIDKHLDKVTDLQPSDAPSQDKGHSKAPKEDSISSGLEEEISKILGEPVTFGHHHYYRARNVRKRLTQYVQERERMAVVAVLEKVQETLDGKNNDWKHDIFEYIPHLLSQLRTTNKGER